jgi:hypothetical protein
MAQTRRKEKAAQQAREDAALDALLGETADPTNPAELGGGLPPTPVALGRADARRLADRAFRLCAGRGEARGAGELTERLKPQDGADRPRRAALGHLA